MFRKTIIATLILSNFISFSQEKVSSIPIDLKKNRDVFQTVNYDTNKINLFISDKTKVKAIQLDEKMQIVDSISSERPDTKTYSQMIGYTTNQENNALFWSSNNYKEILTAVYDFKNRKTSTKQHSLALKDEKILQKFSDKDFFYLLTVVKKSNDLKLYIFDKEGEYIEKKINLDAITLYNSEYMPSTLSEVLGENLLPFEAPFSLQNIAVENPTSLTDSAKKRKCYFQNNKILITLDTNIEFTQIITIDLKDFKVSEKKIKTHDIQEDRMYLSSNSFYFDNKLYQLKSSSKLLYLTVNDLEGNILKEYSATSSEPIYFKNSEVQLEGGDFGGKRVLENSSQFIRKINNLYLGLSIYSLGQNTLITYGGVSPAQQSAGGFGIGMGQFGSMGVLFSVAVYNPVIENFNSYANRKVVKTDGLFDKEGNHIKGDLKPLAFDKIRTFFDEYKDVSSQTLFKTDAYYLGYYDNTTKEYIFRKFND
nr:hypothetical protein [uncultured Flavobacterium sp.]